MSHFLPHLEKFASEITQAFKVQANFNPEDQLKGPILALLEAAGQLANLQVKSVTEVQSGKIGRPDVRDGQEIAGGACGIESAGQGRKPGTAEGAR
jgi:hypothetical protein